MTYSVHVANVGTIYQSDDKNAALLKYLETIKTASEDVALFSEDGMMDEHHAQ